MIRSLLVILVPVLIITFLFTRLPQDHPVKEVDWRPVLATARSQAPYPVLAPVNLPAGWRATRVAWVKVGDAYLNGQASPRNYWQLDLLTPDNDFIGLSQGDQQVDDMVRADTRAGSPDGDSTVNGTPWRRLLSPDGRTRSLVLSQPQVTTVVSADLPYEALDAYAATLSPGP
jgi:hypothetical protein